MNTEEKTFTEEVAYARRDHERTVIARIKAGRLNPNDYSIYRRADKRWVLRTYKPAATKEQSA